MRSADFRGAFFVEPALDLTLELKRPTLAEPDSPGPKNLAGLTRAQLQAALVESGAVEPAKAKMRASQIWRWMHHFGVTDFAGMTDIAKDAARRAGGAFMLQRPEVVERQVSQRRHAQVADPLRAGRRGRDASSSPTSAGPARSASPARSAAR